MKKIILIAENDEYVSKAIKVYIGDTYDVRFFSDLCKFGEDIDSVDTIFIRMDETYWNSHALFKRIRQDYFHIKLVWMSTNRQDAITAFEENADAFLLLPPTEENVSNVIKRLKFIKTLQRY